MEIAKHEKNPPIWMLIKRTLRYHSSNSCIPMITKNSSTFGENLTQSMWRHVGIYYADYNQKYYTQYVRLKYNIF